MNKPAADAAMREDEPASAVAKNIVKPVANAIRILRYLSRTGKPARTTQVARALAINTSTCFNILRTLVSEGVVDFDPLAKTYRPGVGILNLVDQTLNEGQRVELARPLLHDLADRFSVTATLWRRIGDDRIVLAAVEHSAGDLRIHMSTGQRLPHLVGATGRLWASELGLSKAQIAAAFGSLRWDRPVDLQTYQRDVEEVAERGWAIDDGHFSHGITTIAVPVYDPQGAMALALSALLFRGQCDAAGLEALGQEMKRLSPRLTQLLY